MIFYRVKVLKALKGGKVGDAVTVAAVRVLAQPVGALLSAALEFLYADGRRRPIDAASDERQDLFDLVAAGLGDAARAGITIWHWECVGRRGEACC